MASTVKTPVTPSTFPADRISKVSTVIYIDRRLTRLMGSAVPADAGSAGHRRALRKGAGRCMDYDDSPPEQIAAAIAQEIGREVDYRDVEIDGAARAAQHLAELL
jgi:hypothetical protein